MTARSTARQVAEKPACVDELHDASRDTLRGLLPEADWVAVCLASGTEVIVTPFVYSIRDSPYIINKGGLKMTSSLGARSAAGSRTRPSTSVRAAQGG